MFVRLFLLLTLLGTAFSQSDQGIFSGSQTAKEGAPGILPDMFHAITGESGKTPEISTAELQLIMRRNAATVFDTRPGQEYSMGHIPGAVNASPKPGVPISQYVSDSAEIGRAVKQKEAPIVLYCKGQFCGKSKRLADELLATGYTNVRRYQLASRFGALSAGPPDRDRRCEACARR
jgi:rhodanese-related sulfurtransferase